MIFQKARTDSLSLIKKLNMCAMGLDNIELLSQMPQVEVLSFSVNNLRNLKGL